MQIVPRMKRVKVQKMIKKYREFQYNLAMYQLYTLFCIKIKKIFYFYKKKCIQLIYGQIILGFIILFDHFLYLGYFHSWYNLHNIGQLSSRRYACSLEIPCQTLQTFEKNNPSNTLE